MARNSAGSSNQAHFSRIPSVKAPRSVFRRDFTHKTTFDAGYLIPFFVDEILPGDTMSLQTHHLTRLATPIFPYMDNVFIDFHFWFVPNRLVWENWERFNGAQDDPGDSVDFLVPQLDDATHAAGFGENTIYDWLGLPIGLANVPQAEMPNALVFRAYNLIWNEWYRDENLQDSLEVPKDDGPDTVHYAVQRRGRRKDYFTSALPWPQKGPSVAIPFLGDAPVYGRELTNTGLGRNLFQTWADDRMVGSPTVNSIANDSGQRIRAYDNSTSTVDGAYFSLGGPNDYTDSGGATGARPPYADLSEATAATINQLREAFQLQKLFERDARGGTRYVEILLSHFGVVSPDFRLQRPEYLGGGTSAVNVNPVPQTSESSESPQGNLAAFATSSGRIGFNHSFVEHGHVIGLVSVRADVTYQQGMNRMWSRQTRFDFYWPTLAHLGEQAVLNKEIYMVGNGHSDNNGVFGYQERFAEYRYKPSMVTGTFRSSAAQSLDAWHLALDFEQLPTLYSLVEEDPPISRIVAVDTEPQFLFDSFTRIKHVRAMPTYSVPGLIDHF